MLCGEDVKVDPLIFLGCSHVHDIDRNVENLS